MTQDFTPGRTPLVVAVILNWNGWADSLPCVQSLLDSSYENLRIIVVDNGSTDGSVGRLRGAFPDLTILETGANLGFAAGNNRGIHYALDNGAEYVLVLNNDTTVPQHTVRELIDFAERNPGVALIGPEISDAATGEFIDLPMLHPINVWSILLTKSPIQRVIRRTRLYKLFFYRGRIPNEVYAIHGSAMLLPASTISKIGFFDEETFIYWEEFILAEKLRKAGLRTYVLPSTRIIHKGSSSIAKIGASRFLENMKSEKYFFDNYLDLSIASRFVINTVRFVGYIGRTVVQGDYRRRLPEFLRLLFTNKNPRVGDDDKDLPTK